MNESHPAPQKAKERVLQIAGAVADDLDADVILYNGAISCAGADLLIEKTASLRRRRNALLLLVTRGGNPDAAYRIARWLQRKYERFILYVSGYSKSAGTLIAVGAHELVISERGELGPLDIQISKRDELLESQSGLDVQATLATLQAHVLDTFVSTLLQIKTESEGTASLRMAAEIATSMATGLFAPLYGQIDPINIGETIRAMDIANEYGERLLDAGGNIGMEQLNRIVFGYPSHEFVIDRNEAQDLFSCVRNPKEKESELADLLGRCALYQVDADDTALPIVRVLSPEPAGVATKSDACSAIGGNNGPAAHDAQQAPEEVGQDAD